MDSIKTAHQARVKQKKELSEQLTHHKEQVDSLSKDDAEMGAVSPGNAGATVPEDPMTGFITHARTVLQGAQEPNDEQQKELIKAL